MGGGQEKGSINVTIFYIYVTLLYIRCKSLNSDFCMYVLHAYSVNMQTVKKNTWNQIFSDTFWAILIWEIILIRIAYLPMRVFI